MTSKSSSSNRITKSLISKLEVNPHIEGLELDVVFLEKILIQAINDYYNTDKPLLTDATFDILENILREKKPNSKVFDKVGAPVVNPEDAVKLPYYLGSLDKVKPNEKSLTKWLSKHNKEIVISEKLDGLSCLFIMSPGSGVDFQMKLYKHGDGFEGQDISHLLDNIAISSNNRLDKKEIIKKIETVAEKQTVEILQSNVSMDQSSDSLKNVMKMGTEEFKAKMGRYPTYSEMREMFG
jgi:NAD-dependent DNA ligase